MKVTRLLPAACTAALLSLAACGGGGGSSGTPMGSAGVTAVSSGSITAFGSVFVNGHEFATTNAQVIDDDTQASTTSTANLEVGMAVDVIPAASSSDSSPVASEIHVHPLARGVVDASDATANTLTVMGQTVQLTASTAFSDHRACLTAASTCPAIAGPSGLTATTGAGASATAGTYVTVDGYLFAGGTPSGGADIVATLVSVRDLPAGTSVVNFKAEGVVTALAGTTATIGGLAVDLSAATCHANHAVTPCASAFAVGQVISAFSAVEPVLPVASFQATTALLRNKIVVETAGANVELEGEVASVTISPAAFVVRGVTIDASALTGVALPAVGDRVRVLGTVASGEAGVTATALTLLHAARSASVGFEGDVGSVSAGASANTYVLTLLGQSITVNSSARLADLSVRGGHRGDSASNPFNIITFQTYLAASNSQHLLVQSATDAGGNLTALSVIVVPASARAGIAGVVDAIPAPVNSSATGTSSTFSVHGLAINADPAAIVNWRHGQGASAGAAVAVGDFVLARGSYSTPILTVAVPSGELTPFSTNIVIDTGVPSSRDHDGF